MLEHDRLDEALATLGALLEERGEAIGVLVVGGGSLLLLGVIERPTADVDVWASRPEPGTPALRSSPSFWRLPSARLATPLGSATHGSTPALPA